MHDGRKTTSFFSGTDGRRRHSSFSGSGEHSLLIRSDMQDPANARRPRNKDTTPCSTLPWERQQRALPRMTRGSMITSLGFARIRQSVWQMLTDR